MSKKILKNQEALDYIKKQVLKSSEKGVVTMDTSTVMALIEWSSYAFNDNLRCNIAIELKS